MAGNSEINHSPSNKRQQMEPIYSALNRAYHLNDEWHVVPLDEWEATERTGRSSIGSYATIPTQYDTAPGKLAHLNERPGATHPGVFPIHGTGLDFQRSQNKTLHLSSKGGNTRCGEHAEETFRLTRILFRDVMGSGVACYKCERLYLRDKEGAPGKYHWNGSRCTHVLGRRALINKDRILSGDKFNRCTPDEMCQGCRAQFLEA